MNQLPPEIFPYIVRNDIEVYKALIKASPYFARMTVSDNDYWKNMFVEVRITQEKEEWYFNGKLHREGDMPAIIWANGTQLWCFEDRLHREGGMPAVMRADGTQMWYFNGKLHREGDMPAMIWANGTQMWYFEGRLHREGGKPAVIDADGSQEWYFEGRFYTGQYHI